MPSWLITGSNRGIGFATVQNLLKDEANFVIATTRSDSEDLNTLAAKNKNLRIIHLDIASQASVDAALAAATPLLPNGLDYLINNAGKITQPHAKFEDLDLDVFAEELVFSTIGHLRVSRAFLPLIKKSKIKKIIFISTVLASSDMTFMMVNQLNAYSVEKAALNMLQHKWAASLKDEGVTTAAIHPGWVKTELGDPIKEWMAKYAPNMPRFTPEEAGNMIIQVSEAVTLEKTGQFWNFDGTNLPW